MGKGGAACLCSVQSSTCKKEKDGTQRQEDRSSLASEPTFAQGWIVECEDNEGSDVELATRLT
jgi:hypothetical protein